MACAASSRWTLTSSNVAGIYGAEAAARRYYKASAANLNRDQAARMAAMVPNPRCTTAAHVRIRAGLRLSAATRGMRRCRAESN